MSRSRRKTPLMPLTTAKSDKPYKVAEHQKERRYRNVAFSKSLDGDDKRLHSKVFGDPWNGPKDGKQLIDPKSKWMRK